MSRAPKIGQFNGCGNDLDLAPSEGEIDRIVKGADLQA